MMLKLTLLITAVVQAAAPFVLFLNGFEQESGRAPTPIVPANYAFSIWGLIYGLAVIYAGAQYIAKGDPALERIGLAAIPLFALSTVWLVFARFGPTWGTVPTIVAMLALAIVVLIRLPDAENWLAGYGSRLRLGLFGLTRAG